MRCSIKCTTLLLVTALLIGQPLLAADADMTQVNKLLKTLMPKAQPDSLGPSAMPGLYEAVYGTQIIYISADGKHMIEGDIYSVGKKNGRPVIANLTERKREVGRVKAVANIDKASLIIFSPEKGKTKHVITTFTDIDCGYCRKFHGQMAQYNKLGIEIRYAAFPRSGLETPSYFKAQAVWCAVDRNKAMNIAKAGAKLEQLQQLQQVEDQACKKIIKKHMAVAREVGVSGTPTLVLENGKVLPGFVAPDKIIKILEGAKRG